jgi:hypothetical protein
LLLKFGVEIDAGVRAGSRHHLRLELKVLELRFAVRSDKEQVRPPTADLERAVLNGEAIPVPLLIQGKSCRGPSSVPEPVARGMKGIEGCQDLSARIEVRKLSRTV